MNIIYKTTHDFNSEDLKVLFLSVNWESGKYPDKLVIAMKNFKTVISAWDNDKLVGLICAMDDGIMTSYIHYLLVNPSYQGLHIGKTLVEKLKEVYKDYLKIMLIAYHTKVDFYKSCGFELKDDARSMIISKL